MTARWITLSVLFATFACSDESAGDDASGAQDAALPAHAAHGSTGGTRSIRDSAGTGSTANSGGGGATQHDNRADAAAPNDIADASTATSSDAATSTSTDHWQPKPGTSWQWQLSGALDTSIDAQVYDIDMEGTQESQVADLHAKGRKVICYFDTAYEPDRDDSAKLEAYKGNPVDGWPGQYWLDIREPAVVAVMKARIGAAAAKHCDGIEADDVDSRSNDPGFPITANDQRTFIRTLADAAHAHGLAFGLKNALEDVSALLDVADFAINEECLEYDECDALHPFIAAKKPVFHVEYTDGDLADKGADVCPKANALDFDTLIKHLDLDAPRFACR